MGDDVMSKLTIETLMRICEKLPSDYKVKLVTRNDKQIPISDTIEINIADGILILKE